MVFIFFFFIEGAVYSGSCRGLKVAIKELSNNQITDQVLEDFRRECSMMTYGNNEIFLL